MDAVSPRGDVPSVVATASPPVPQVRVRVIEGHQLQGNDIKPVVTVLIGQKHFRTRIQTGNNPYYNEVFWQNFRRTPARLAAELIVFQVLDSRASRAKAIIGVFQLDIGTIYHAPGRSLSWKWLSLQHPQHPETGSRGYLRVSLAVLRAGETAPEEKAPAGDEDVEANLLRPSPCVATLQLRVYRAEDLPQAEPPRLPVGGKRGFVAAAVRVRFAGRTLCTQVMPPDANPEWNEVFFFPLRLPPICDEIQLAILSGSRSSKVLGTATLRLSQISSAGAELEEGTPGFLPCFGPSFLPFYGPRSDPARTPSTRHLPRCRRFGLCGIFYSATMVPPGPELLRFELSLGHYGDTSDVTCKPTASVTPYCCPLFDGEWDVGTGTQQALARLEEQPTPTALDAHLRTARLHLLRHMVATAAEPPRAGWDTLLDTAQGWLRRVTALAVEPQAGVPDVLLWLLQGDRRVACARVPVPDIMFSPSGPGACGRFCGRIQTLFLVGSGDIHAQLRLRLWLGRVANSDDLSRHLEGTLHIYAETHSPEAAGTEAWEYGSLWGSRFHLQPRLGDVCRRRCWHRGMVPNQPGARAALFLLEGTPSKEDVAEDDETPAAECPARGSSRTSPKQPMPLILCTFQRPNFFQLRCYIFQALELTPRATKATADPVAHVSFVHVSQSTRVLPGTLDPLWDQTLLFQRVLLYGDPQGVQDEPPMVVVEVFDQDGGGAGAFLGRSVCAPQVWLDVGQRKPPRLQRYPLRGSGESDGELLAAFELLHDTQDGALAQVTPPPWREGVFSVPQGIRPLLRLVALEVLAWGLRGLQGGVRAPSLELQCGGQTLRTPPILNLPTNPNFPINAFLLPLNLPAEEEYVPPIWLRVLDTREFGYRPMVGQACVRGLGRYYWPPPGQGKPPPGPATPSSGSGNGSAQPWYLLPIPDTSDAAQDRCRGGWGQGGHSNSVTGVTRSHLSPPHPAPHQAAEEEKEEDEDEDDWWSKFYAAMGDKAKRRTGRDRLKIYSCELEALPEFEGLQDFCQTFPLYGPGGHPAGGDDPVGEFKGLFHIYPLPEDPAVSPPPRHFQQLPPSQPQKCLVRVYVVRAFDLPPKDRNRLCDPYVRVSLGKKKLGQRDQYVPNTLEPVFGRLFEVTGTIPLEKDLRVTLLDYDVVPPDQEIGTTTIDLENRLLSRYRANCGLAARYRTTGPGCWRDQLPPSRILEHFAHTRGLPAPEFSAEGTTVTFGDQTILLSQFESAPPVHQHQGPPRERLALHVLRRCHLVPEHLETRTLYNSTQPQMEQGKVQMWVDVFPTTLGSPGPPVDITPPKPQRYELRCVVWNTRDIDMGDVNLIGQQMSDIYVMGWLDGLEEQRQRTDIHYRSLQGDGAFNWRFVFSFQCLAAEELCILPHKEHFWSLDPTVRKVPPKLILQVWDNDKFSADEFLGVLELELSRLPQPARQPQNCTPNPQGTPQSPWPWRGTRVPSHFSLFRQKRARGWWPCTVQDGNKQRLSGKLELSLELLTAREAEERPAGRGRDEPNMYPKLQPPMRPEWSFLWLQAPLRTLRYGLWRQHRGRISLVLALLLLLVLLLTFIYSTPVSAGGARAPPNPSSAPVSPPEPPSVPPHRDIWP
ncbi:fer-1-like protein 5 [Columba livia]|uniref:fer-1-like protein 5 n=1 Tax=Columba livia TaxID=8932 RepID=UPI0031BB358B